MDSASGPAPPAPTERQQEIRQRFRWARRLIDDDFYRRRLFLLVTLAAVPLIVALTVIADRLPITRFDLDATLVFQGISFTPVRRFLEFISFFGYEPWAYIVIVVIVGLIALFMGWKDALYTGALILAQGGINLLIKTLIGRPRPVDTLVQVIVPSHGFSFPSGHVMFYTVTFGFLFFLLLLRAPRSFVRTLLLAFSAMLVLFVGPSRVYLGAHWVSDVVAAYLIALVVLLLAVELYLKTLAQRQPSAREIRESARP